MDLNITMYHVLKQLYKCPIKKCTFRVTESKHMPETCDTRSESRNLRLGNCRN